MTRINYRHLTLAAFLALTTFSTFAQTAATSNPKLEAVKATKIEALVSEDNLYSLPWLRIPEINISWKKRVWRDIDAAPSANNEFAVMNTINSLAANLLQGALAGNYKAYDAADDRFTKELTRDELVALITPGKNSPGYNVSSVTKYRIKEDWLFLKEENKLVVRILGIAPVVSVKAADGTVGEEPLFWVFNPDTRDYLAKQKVSDYESWDQVLEARRFTSTVIKVSSPWAAPALAK